MTKPADTPWRGMTVKVAPPSANATAQRKAFKKLSILERECGITLEQYEALHAEQRARVFARYGLDRAA